MMGFDEGRRDQRPQHEVCFSAPFWIDLYEVTNTQYGAPGNFQGDNRPRENLTWFEARDHCARRGARLPTEAEWEYAARGPDSLLYPWGNELIDDNLVFDRNNNNETADVGTRPNGVSWVGAFDMAGNVHEWTNSIYRPYPYDASDGREAPDDLTSTRVYRSSLNSYIDFGASAAMRFSADPNMRDWFVGFRCARDYAGE
jgi:iron(II)-dependent oxidoreductase